MCGEQCLKHMSPRLPLRWENGGLSETAPLATLQQSAGWHGALDCTGVQEMGGRACGVMWEMRSVGVEVAAPAKRSRRRGSRF
jgi:hypothetical protein